VGESRAEEGGNSGSEEVGGGEWVGACGYVLMIRVQWAQEMVG
jgi:hypothetical protein